MTANYIRSALKGIGLFSTGLAVGSFAKGPSDPLLAEAREPDVLKKTDSPTLALDNARRIFSYGNPGPVSDKLTRDGFIVAYDRRMRAPHFVAQIFPNNLGETNEEDDRDRRKCNFAEDMQIPRMFRSHVSDYKALPDFDRGHLAPARDMPSLAAQKESFLLSNILPQHRTLNRGFWGDLESWIRKMCGDFDETIVYTGPMFLPKEDPETKRFYVKYEVAGNPPNTPIPNAFFKVIVASKAGTLHAAAFVVPNEPVSADSKLVDFETPLDSVESATGLEFLRNMDRKTVKRLCASYSCDLSRFHRARKQYRDVQNDA